MTDEEVLPDSVLDDLTLLARGDLDMVEQAICESIEQKGFWKKTWSINMDKVVAKIIERRQQIDDLQVSDAESQINN